MRRTHSKPTPLHISAIRVSSPIYNHNTSKIPSQHIVDMSINKASHRQINNSSMTLNHDQQHSLKPLLRPTQRVGTVGHQTSDMNTPLLSPTSMDHNQNPTSVRNSSFPHLNQIRASNTHEKRSSQPTSSSLVKQPPSSYPDILSIKHTSSLPKDLLDQTHKLSSSYDNLISQLVSPGHSTPRRAPTSSSHPPSLASSFAHRSIKPTSRTHTTSPISPSVSQSIRHYDIPVYHGFRKAFQDQVNSYAQKDVTLVTLEDLINEWLPWYNENLEYMVNHGHLTKGASSTQSKSHQPPSFSVSELEAQIYSPLYQEKLIKNAQFLWQELPIRLAKRVVELEKLPYGLSDTPPFAIVRSWYEQSFRDIISCLPPTNLEEEKNFTRILNSILYRHRHVVPIIAQGILLAKPKIQAATNGQGCPYIKEFLDRFYMSRISMRMLISQHISLHKPLPGYCGNIALFLDPIEVVRNAANEATELCDRTYGKTPEINILFARHNTATLSDATYPDLSYFANQNNTLLSDNDTTSSASETKNTMSIGELTPLQQLHHYHNISTKNDTISYIPSHLHHMIFELVKNSCRATVEHYPDLRRLPDIDITVASGKDDFTIKISDTGCGIKRKDQHKLFGYLHTTTSPSVQESLKRFNIVGNDGQPLIQQPIDGTFSTPPSTYDELFPSSHRSESGLDPSGHDDSASRGAHTDQSSSSSSQSPSNLKSYSGSPAVSNPDYDPYLSQPTRIQVKSQRLSSISSTSFNMDDGTNILISPAEQQGFGSGSKLPPIAGFGYGLALSKLFAKFFGGDLEIHSIENHGTDAFLWLNKLEHNKTQM